MAAVLAIAAAVNFLSRPDLPEVRFVALTGDNFFTSDLHGKVVLISFWATYCPSCVKEMPQLVAMHKRFAARGYETIAVAVKQDQPMRVAQFAAARALPFTIAFDASGEIAKEFGNVRVTPMSFLIDRQGRVLKRYVGEPDWAEVDRLVERALSS